MFHRFFSFLAGFLFLLLATFAAPAAIGAPPQYFQSTQIIGTGLDGPSGFDIAPDGRIFILERAGTVKIYKNGTLLPDPFVVLPSVASGDRGLIGLAFDPDFATNKYVYFYYTGLDLLNRLVRFSASGDIATDGPVILYQTSSLSEQLHVGGSIGFGPDGKLYFAVGDNGYPPNAQSLGNPHGKLLRINRDGTTPSDNPFLGTPNALPELWAYGMRNPWRFSFDSVTGYMYDGDVGDYTWEEINRVERGKNYGWPLCEGVCNDPSFTDPIYTYNHDGLSSAVTAGPVYRGSMFPTDYAGRLFFGDYARGFIRTLSLDGSGNSTGVSDFDTSAGSVVDLKVAPDGSLYYSTYYPGRLYRISYSTTNQVPVANSGANQTHGVAPFTVSFTSAGSIDPEGNPLTFLWDFGDGTTSTDTNPIKTYSVNGAYTVELQVSDGTNTAQAVPLVIQVGIPPIVTIGSPQNGTTYKAGDTINYTVSAIDGVGNDLNDGAISTEILFHHDTHIHPFLGPFIGRTGSFQTPTSGEAAADTWFEIRTTASDTSALSTTSSVSIYPITSQMTIATSPLGLFVKLDGSPYSAPHTIAGVVNFQRELSVDGVQSLGGITYRFVRWSDDGAQTHTITTPESNTTYTALFEETGGPPPDAFTGEYFTNKSLTGPPTLVRSDQSINFIWDYGSPAPTIPGDNFSARWSKTQSFTAGTYRFTTTADDGVRVMIDGTTRIDGWVDQSAATYTADIVLSAGNHTIVMEYYENGGRAQAQLSWQEVAPAPPTNGFAAQYFTNSTLTGTPAVTRTDTAIDFDWAWGSPAAEIPGDNFSARWTKTETFAPGTYRFTTTGDDGVRVIIDGTTLIDRWIDQSPTTYYADTSLTTGTHTVVMEFYEKSGTAVAQLSWASVTPPPPPPTNGFAAEYYSNMTLSGVPLVTRTDAEINFDWGYASPDPQIPSDTFSTRWTRSVPITGGVYRFTVTADDGVRLYLDGNILLDRWVDQSPTTYSVDANIIEGNHTIVVEYYENGGGAVAKVTWSLASENTVFSGEYFSNSSLSGTPILVRDDPSVDFSWGWGSPSPQIPADQFSVRWSAAPTFSSSSYRFSVTGDDGIRLIIDGSTVLDKWVDQSPMTYIVDIPMTQGIHQIVLEYYEHTGGAVAELSWIAL